MIRSQFGKAKPKLRKCKVCRVNPVANQMASVCGFECSLKKVEMDNLKKAAKREQEERAAHRVRKQAAKKHGEWEGDLQKLVNKWVRVVRDVNEPCISCGTTKTVQWEAGHYIAVGANNTLRFVLDNIHKQCHRCNVQLSSNAIMYRVALVKKIGVERVEWLEGPHATNKISIPELQAEIARYKGLIKLADKEVA